MIFPKGEFFHVFNKSISNFNIFNKSYCSQRFINVTEYYNQKSVTVSFSDYIKKHPAFNCNSLLRSYENPLIKVIAYCIMPDHYHYLLKIIEDKSLSKFIANIENSYTRYFNCKFKRKGPLWQSVFKAVLIKGNEQLLHVSRYIHLNPTTKKLVNKPEEWTLSSYKSYINNSRILSSYLKEISIQKPSEYKKFVEDGINYQRNLYKIRKSLLE